MQAALDGVTVAEYRAKQEVIGPKQEREVAITRCKDTQGEHCLLATSG